MARSRPLRPRAVMAALPLSALPELRELLSPWLGGDSPRARVVMVRLGEDAGRRLDQLVEAGLFASRSEAAAFLIGAGLEAQAPLFGRIRHHASEIQKLRRALRESAVAALRDSAAARTRRSAASPAPARGRKPR